jgi:small subunit ribosomal protein S2
MANKKTDVTLEELLAVGAHFGHQVRRWNPKMEEYIFGEKEGVHVFDLAKTKEALLEALEVIQKAAKEGKVILFVGTKKQAKDKVKEVAQAAGMPYVDLRWLGGTLTNFEQMQRSVKHLSEMKKKWQEGEYEKLTKKERLLIEREIAKMEKKFGGIAQMTALPDLLVIIDTKREAGAVREAKMKGIETVGIVDTNADPTEVTYPVPMNDDATKAVEFVLDKMKAVLVK